MRDFRLDQEKIKLQSIKLTLASISRLILAYLLVPKSLNIYILLTIAALMMVVDLLVYYIKSSMFGSLYQKMELLDKPHQNVKFILNGTKT